jgi:ribonucleoside-diphosphate reductase alpha chain
MKGTLMTYQVKKRNGEIEAFDPTKWENQLKKVCQGIDEVSAFTIAATAQAQFKPFMTTEELDEIALRSMVNLIDVEKNPIGHTNYQYVAGRQRITMLRKKVYGSFTVPHILEIVKKNVEAKLYTPDLLTWYSEEEWDQINSFIDHGKDETYTYAQVEQFVDKYLVRNRFTDTIVESPQVRYIIAAATSMHAEKNNI